LSGATDEWIPAQEAAMTNELADANLYQAVIAGLDPAIQI
jgi:hypothetical protein